VYEVDTEVIRSALCLLWPPYVIGGHYIFTLGFLSIFYRLSFFFFLAKSQRPQIGCIPYFYTWRGPSANLECRSEMCCTRARCKCRTQKSRQKSPSGHHPTTLSGYIFATKPCIDNRQKLVKQQYLLYMSPQYGELRPASG